MPKGCKLYVISSLNENGDTEGLEDFLVVSDFADFFPEELPRVPPKRELEFTIELKCGIEPIERMPYQMSTPELKELNM
jgi:hypothetical protein